MAAAAKATFLNTTAPTLLAVGWLVVPAAQYFASVQRTGMQLEGGAAYESLALLDLTPLYTILLCATLLLAIARALRSMPPKDAGRETS